MPEDLKQIFYDLERAVKLSKRRPQSVTEQELIKLKNDIQNLDSVSSDHLDKIEELRDESKEYTHPPSTRKDIEQLLDVLANKADGNKIPDIEITDDDNVVFLLGAGASYASDIPTVDRMLPHLLDQAKRMGREDLEPLIQYCEQRNDIDIEDLLTAAYLADFGVSDRHIVRLLHYFLFSNDSASIDNSPTSDAISVNFIQNTFQTLFGLLASTMIDKDPNPTHNAICDFVSKHPNSSIVTTNYDYCMDQELMENDISIVSNIHDKDSNFRESVELLKMHGSINWAYCDSCQAVGEFNPEFLKETYKKDRMSFAVTGICPECQGSRQPLLVPPISFKFLMFPSLIDVWSSASRALDEADYIIVVGYSFSDSDAYITKLISKSIADKQDTKLINVNPTYTVTSELREHFDTILDGFSPKDRIKGVYEGSEVVMDEMLTDFYNSVQSNHEENQIGSEPIEAED